MRLKRRNIVPQGLRKPKNLQSRYNKPQRAYNSNEDNEVILVDSKDLKRERNGAEKANYSKISGFDKDLFSVPSLIRRSRKWTKSGVNLKMTSQNALKVVFSDLANFKKLKKYNLLRGVVRRSKSAKLRSGLDSTRARSRESVNTLKKTPKSIRSHRAGNGGYGAIVKGSRYKNRSKSENLISFSHSNDQESIESPKIAPKAKIKISGKIRVKVSKKGSRRGSKVLKSEAVPSRRYRKIKIPEKVKKLKIQRRAKEEERKQKEVIRQASGYGRRGSRKQETAQERLRRRKLHKEAKRKKREKYLKPKLVATQSSMMEEEEVYESRKTDSIVPKMRKSPKIVKIDNKRIEVDLSESFDSVSNLDAEKLINTSGETEKTSSKRKEFKKVEKPKIAKGRKNSTINEIIDDHDVSLIDLESSELAETPKKSPKSPNRPKPQKPKIQQSRRHNNSRLDSLGSIGSLDNSAILPKAPNPAKSLKKSPESQNHPKEQESLILAQDELAKIKSIITNPETQKAMLRCKKLSISPVRKSSLKRVKTQRAKVYLRTSDLNASYISSTSNSPAKNQEKIQNGQKRQKIVLDDDIDDEEPQYYVDENDFITQDMLPPRKNPKKSKKAKKKGKLCRDGVWRRHKDSLLKEPGYSTIRFASYRDSNKKVVVKELVHPDTKIFSFKNEKCRVEFRKLNKVNSSENDDCVSTDSVISSGMEQSVKILFQSLINCGAITVDQANQLFDEYESYPIGAKELAQYKEKLELARKRRHAYETMKANLRNRAKKIKGYVGGDETFNLGAGEDEGSDGSLGGLGGSSEDMFI